MSWLLFMDESGHDHRTMPYEVRAGIAMHATKLWPFIMGIRALEQAIFGTLLSEHGKEIKGCKLLDNWPFAGFTRPKSRPRRGWPRLSQFDASEWYEVSTRKRSW